MYRKFLTAAVAATALAATPIAAQAAVERSNAAVTEEADLGGSIGPAFIIILIAAAGMAALLLTDDDDEAISGG